MRIGILTLPLHVNYGGILQAYALQTVLERMGHDVHIIERKKKPLRIPNWRKPLCYGKRILKNLAGHNVPVFYEKKYYKDQSILMRNTSVFINTYLKVELFDEFNDIKENDFDAIVVGSDQVWRSIFFRDVENAYLKFTKGWKIKRISYAASFGTEIWEYSKKKTKECKQLLVKFDAVSVREESAINLCQKYLGVKAQHVMDPTMLLQMKDYSTLFLEKNTPVSEGNLMVYLLDMTDEKNRIVDFIAKETGLQPFRTNNNVNDMTVPAEQRIQPPLECWLRGFYDANFIMTDSFHACVFSILFKKQFVVCGNEKRGMSRLLSLLKMFGIEDRFVSTFEDCKHLNEIDYDTVYEKLERYKAESMAFINKALC